MSTTFFFTKLIFNATLHWASFFFVLFLAEIVIDDRLPVRKGRAIYLRSSSELEFWPALLEKAYAKAKGSYELLNR